MLDADARARAERALARLQELHRDTNCVADRADDLVLAATQRVPDGPLHGEPVTVKDWIDVAGFRCSGGEVDQADRRPAADATAVSRLRAAGAVVVAKTAVGVDSERFGAVTNPHDLSLSPGGSSSGEGVAVGGGAVRLGIGSDSGGSVRVPAAWCRVVGMKPSAGLVPLTGHFPPEVGDRVDGRTVIGPLAASVDLAWLAVRAMAGPDGSDGGTVPVPPGDPDRVDVGSVRIAVGSPGGASVGPEVAAALDVAGRAVRAAGAVDAGEPPGWLDEARRITEAHWGRGRRTGTQVDQELEDWDRFRTWVLSETADVDALITPTVPDVAPPHREMQTEDYLFCLPASLTGAPAISVPVGTGSVQVIAHRWRDDVAVAVARVVEAAARAVP